MKNLYTKLFTILMFCSAGAYSQSALHKQPGKMVTANVKTTPVKGNHMQNQKDFDNPIWTSDFSDPSDWLIGNDAGNSDDWVIGTQGPSGDYAIATIQSTTADNGFALFDSDLLCSGSQNAWIQNADGIDLTGETGVSLRFETYYREYLGSCYIETSTDGTNWGNPVQILIGADPTPNPLTFQLPLEGIAGSQTAYFRFRYEGGCDYAWMIDDVALASQPEYDLSLDNGYFNDWIVDAGTIANQTTLSYIPAVNGLALVESYEYSSFQKDAVRPLSFTALLTNLGSEDLTGITLTATVTVPDGSTETFTSDGNFALASNTVDTLVIADQELAAFDLSGNAPQIGTYTVSYSVTTAETDENEANNEIMEGSSFQVDEELMANDRGDVINSVYTTLANDVIWANRMAFEEDQAVNFIQFAVTNLTTASGEVFETQPGEVLYLNVGTGYVFEQEGDDIIDEAYGLEDLEYVTEESAISDAANPAIMITYMLPDTLMLAANTIHQAEVHIPASGTPVIFMPVVGLQESYAGVVYQYSPTSGNPRWSPLGANAPIIRLGYSAPVGIEGPSPLDFKVSQNYPNPTMGQTQIDWELMTPAKNITFHITDNTGKEVYRQDLGDRPAGVQGPLVLNLDLAAGIYQYGLQIGNQRIVRKMTIVK